MAKFCSKCGMKLNEQTGKCPNCDEKTKMDTASSDSNISINGNPKEDQNIKKTNGEQEVKKESKKKITKMFKFKNYRYYREFWEIKYKILYKTNLRTKLFYLL